MSVKSDSEILEEFSSPEIRPASGPPRYAGQALRPDPELAPRKLAEGEGAEGSSSRTPRASPSGCGSRPSSSRCSSRSQKTSSSS